MSFDIFITFDGDCRKALGFYTKVFAQEMPTQIMTYGENPDGCSDADRDRIIYSSMPLFGMNIMFCDCPTGNEHIKGNNISLTVGMEDEAEIKRIFQALCEGGEVYMPLGKTFFSELFGMVCDQFGIIWQFSKSA